MFKRRKKLNFFDQLRNLIWPRIGMSRFFRYIMYRFYRLSASSASIAIGFASGAAVSMTPFLGFHFIMSFLLSKMLRGNIFAGFFGTIVLNPWTLPIIWNMNYFVGTKILYPHHEFKLLDIEKFILLLDAFGVLIKYYINGILFSFWDIKVIEKCTKLWNDAYDFLWPLLIGSILTGLLSWLIFFVLFYILMLYIRRPSV